MGEDLVELAKAMAKEVAVDLEEMGSGFAAVEEAENPPLSLTASFAHDFFSFILCSVKLRITS